MMHHRFRASRQHGFTLVELMVALTLSLLVLLAILSLYLAQKRTFNTQDSYSNIQDSGRLLSRILTHDLRLAGYTDVTSTVVSIKDSALSGTNNTGLNNSDSVTIKFYGASKAVTLGTSATTPDNSIVDCAGTGVARDLSVVQTYTVASYPAVGGVPTLMCSVNGGTAVPLVSGVETLQILYGVDLSANQDGSQLAYLQAGQVADFQKVKSVKISVILQGTGEATKGNFSPQTSYDLFGEKYASLNAASDPGTTYAVTPDGLLRQMYSFTAVVRNRITN